MDPVSPLGGAELTRGDRIAIAAAYNQLFAHGASSGDAAVRDPVTGLSPGRACVAGIVALGGLVSFLANNDTPTDFSTRMADLVRAAVAATNYPDLGP